MESILAPFRAHLIAQERSAHTLRKYLRDTARFLSFAQGRPVTRELVIAYKAALLDRGFAVRSINSMLASVNSYLDFLGLPQYKARSLRQQRSVYCPEDRELTRQEYLRLLSAADPRLNLVLNTICATGIRVSELQYFTVEALKRGEVVIHCKAKTRTILLPGRLRSHLLRYARSRGISAGVIFRTRGGRPLDRSNIWSAMKRLCRKAGVAATKVFPHNLRKLFARTFYAQEKDIAKLADLLGHSSIDTTRIYIMSTGKEHRRKLEQLHLVL